MGLKYGYEIDVDGHEARIITPPLLNKTITVSSTENTNRWVFYGTRPEILGWIKNHSHIVLENGLFINGRPVSFQTHTEIVIDLLPYNDPEQSVLDYMKSFIKTDYQNERIKVEIRPRVESKDQVISTLSRVIIKSGVSLGEILPDLYQEWYQPTRNYFEQISDLINDNPGPVHIASTDSPMNIEINRH